MALGIEEKLARIAEGTPPRLLDLFSGCGGLTLGFVSAGCVSVGGVELDKDAARSYAANFHSDKEGCSRGLPEVLHALPRDILKIKPRELLRDLERGSNVRGIDLLIGGPPCPAFTRVGRAKLREIAKHPEAFKHDPRATLYRQYLDYVKALRPVALVMENVPDILNWGGHNLGAEICEALEQLDYECRYTLLNAAHYGVPQMRERFFLVAIHKDARREPGFPTPTHRVDFPPGYKGARNVALKNVLKVDPWFQTPLVPPLNAPSAVTAGDALSDLPPLTAHLTGDDRRGARHLDGKVPYGERAVSPYARFMRTWPGFQQDGYLRDHVTRCLTQRDYRLFERMASGADYPRAHKLAVDLFNEELKRRQKRGESFEEGSESYEKLRASYVPPYDPEKFPNKWRKMDKGEPARTLMAHLGKDTYSHIHYDSAQQRVISVREAARLQSFPDGFRFSGTMNPAFRQIGNSVPPLLAWAIAYELLERLGARVRHPVPDFSGPARFEDKQSVRVA
ncbi:DNA cytosine methyltransferase [Cystobacter fuscus]|uniref:DNA cytosine methyltransferase n=1 Tax=Cystobacter fuscus TaxID=43 RepID=UPI002B2E05F4|nr:DNA cytosine methyltransferase [Cystobacter fuscus]